MKKIDIRFSCWLSNKREKRRLKRLQRANKKNEKTNPSKEIFQIYIPNELDLDRNRGKLTTILKNIQSAILSKSRFKLDHRNMKKISKEALLLLVAEIERCTKLSDIKLKGNRKLFPKCIEVKRLLDDIGYWEYFNIKREKSKNSTLENCNVYLKIVSDTVVSGEKIGGLITFFEELVCFDVKTRDKFSDAMTEAAANTVEHAYVGNQKIETIDKWWLTASLNKDTDEISFIFYDQGSGILNTLESTHQQIKLKRLIAGWVNQGFSKGGILKKLVTTNLSSYKDERRGNGLISFKSFIDEVESGELTIYTDDISYSVVSDDSNSYDDNINGTLISWKIRANHNNSSCIYIKEVDGNECK